MVIFGGSLFVLTSRISKLNPLAPLSDALIFTNESLKRAAPFRNHRSLQHIDGEGLHLLLIGCRVPAARREDDVAAVLLEVVEKSPLLTRSGHSEDTFGTTCHCRKERGAGMTMSGRQQLLNGHFSCFKPGAGQIELGMQVA